MIHHKYALIIHFFLSFHSPLILFTIIFILYLFFVKIFIEVLKSRFKEYHLTSQRENNEELATVFKFVDTDSWYLYTPNLGLFNSSKENIKSMLNSGWKSKSNSLFDDLENNKTL